MTGSRLRLGIKAIFHATPPPPPPPLSASFTPWPCACKLHSMQAALGVLDSGLMRQRTGASSNAFLWSAVEPGPRLLCLPLCHSEMLIGNPALEKALSNGHIDLSWPHGNGFQFPVQLQPLVITGIRMWPAWTKLTGIRKG